MSLHPFTAEILENHPKLTAEVIDTLTPLEIAALIKQAPNKIGIRIINPLSQWKCLEVIKLLPRKKTIEILTGAATEDALKILRKLPKSTRSPLINTLSEAKQTQINTNLSFPKESVGAWMNPSPLSAPGDYTVREAIHLLQETKGVTTSNIINLHIVDKNNQLKGVLSISELIQLNPQSKVLRVMQKGIKELDPHQTLRDTNAYLEWEEFSSLPVTDPDQGLIGELTLSRLRRGHDALRHQQKTTENNRTNPFWDSLEAGDAFVSGTLDLLPKSSKRK